LFGGSIVDCYFFFFFGCFSFGSDVWGVRDGGGGGGGGGGTP